MSLELSTNEHNRNFSSVIPRSPRNLRFATRKEFPLDLLTTLMTEIRSYEVTRNSVTNEIISRRDLGVIDYELVISNWGRRETIPSLRRMWNSSSPAVNLARTYLSIPSAMLGFASVSLAHFTELTLPAPVINQNHGGIKFNEH